MSETLAWLIFFLPIASFVLIGLGVRPLFPRQGMLAGYLTVLAVGGSFLLSLVALRATVGHEEPIGWPSHVWLTIGDFTLRVGIRMDALTAVMLVVVSGVSLAVQVYSLGYMKGDPGMVRYFAYMSLFTASMLGLVLSSNLILVYVFWELVGLCSYLLIGFWYERPAAAAAAKKAFIVTRIGDLGFLLALLYLFTQRQAFLARGLDPFDIGHLHNAVAGGLLSGTALTWLGLGIFAGAVGKSAQFPLHVWLPDAMEGPTPVSALIHAATMVAAGVFLVARVFPVFEASPALMDTVALIGAFTTILAATMGMVMNDIKRVIAYSTISQLGLMMLALGVGAYSAAVFHLFNHAFFKALLFLGAGSVNHATGTFDMRLMGGLRRYMPWTYVTFLVASLSLAGVFPLSGFWSKDEILAEALTKGDGVALLVGILALVGVFLTAFYAFRALFLTFHGPFRGGAEAEASVSHHNGHSPGHSRVHLGESPLVMLVPMLLLGVLAIASGVVANPPTALGPVPAHWFGHFVVKPGAHAEKVSFNLGIALVSTLLALGGIGLAWLMYGVRRLPAERVTVRPVYQVVARKYYMDDLYEGVLAGRLFYRFLCGVADWLDRVVVDGVVEGVGWLGRSLGRPLAWLQSGQLQAYASAITLGIVLIIIAYMVWR
ncbi:MAG: NADH-quinone oxidoreductase subunit L [Dehalococcoidia bacterium]|nr:NADH-quinone oxidoreductase subunit L [Dehalococcoidia bacterium]MDW8119237.1 NADH-quinone oxidoreductase subunit L [Chloroflexota bacterium]